MAHRVNIWYRKDRRKWYGQYRISGTRHTKSFDSKADAVTWRKWMLHKLNYEEWKGHSDLHMEGLKKLYMIHKKAEDIADNTKKEIDRVIQKFIKVIGNIQVHELNQGHIEQFILEIKKIEINHGKDKPKTLITNRSINRHIESVRAMYNWAVEQNYCKTKIKFKPLKTKKREFRPPEQNQLKKLFEEAKQYPEIYVRMIIALYTGLRRSAIDNLKTNEIDFDNKLLLAYERKTQQYRTKVLGNKCIGTIKHYIKTNPSKTEKLFRHTWNKSIKKNWKDIREEVKLPNFTFHNLRNMSATCLAQSGESPSMIQRHLGHSSYQTTNGYIGIAQSDEERIASKLDKIIETL